MNSQEGRVALVTGGSKGIGRAIAEGLGRHGAKLLIAARNPDGTVKELQAAGMEASALPIDLAVEDPTDTVRKGLERYGRIDIVVHSAGANIRRPALELTLEEWRIVQRVNVEAAFLLARASAPDMLDRRWGRMVFITSIQAFQGGYRLPLTAYTTAKAAMVGLARGLGKEWAKDGIRVNCLAPGFTRTDLTGGLQAQQELADDITSRIPVGRWGETRDVVEPALFLCSDGAEFVTGQTLVVDGGWMVY